MKHVIKNWRKTRDVKTISSEHVFKIMADLWGEDIAEVKMRDFFGEEYETETHTDKASNN